MNCLECENESCTACLELRIWEREFDEYFQEHCKPNEPEPRKIDPSYKHELLKRFEDSKTKMCMLIEQFEQFEKFFNLMLPEQGWQREQGYQQLRRVAFRCGKLYESLKDASKFLQESESNSLS